MNEISSIDSFSAFQKDIQKFLTYYLDNYQKENFFKLNKMFYSKMLVCFDNIRQTNEKIEECIKQEEKKKEKLTQDMRRAYSSNLKILEDCCDKCYSKDDLKCLINCGNDFKQNYDRNMRKVIDVNYNSLL